MPWMCRAASAPRRGFCVTTPTIRTLAGTAPLAVITLLLAGCSVGPKFVRPNVAINEHWANVSDSLVTTQAPVDSAWWRAFDDPILDDLVALAYHQNLPLQVAGLRILESRARLGIATGRRYPQFQAAFGSATAVGLSENAPNTFSPDRHFWDFQIGFDAVWEMDFWRKYGSEVSAEEASYFASIADYDDALVSLTAEVARTYAVIRTFEEQIQLAQTNATLQEEGQRIARARFRHGATSELDVTQATTLLESTRATIPLLQIGLQQAQNALSTLLGQPTGAIQATLQETKGIPRPSDQVAINVPAEMLRRRPDIRGAELNAMAQSDRIGVARADLYPSFSLAGTIGFENNSAIPYQSSGSLFGSNSLFYSFGPRFLWPLFNYGRIQNNVRVQDARLQQLLVGYEDTVLRAAQEVEDGLAGLVHSREAEVFARNAAEAADRSVHLAFLQYREGAIDFQRVIDAERSLLQEQNNLAQTRSSLATSAISVYKALGGGWEMRKGQPILPQGMQEEMRKRTNWGDYFSEPPRSPTTSNDR